jgi:drug/metabolite transporter (DMT)-like permease
VYSKQKAYAIASLLTGATTWGLIWYPLRLLENAGVGGELSTLLTYGLSLVIGMAIFARHVPALLKLSPILAGIGLFAGGANLAYVLGVIHGSVVRVLLLFYLAPLWTVVLSRLLLGEKLNRTGYVIILLSIAGAVVMLWEPELDMPWPKGGAEWLGLGAGVMFAMSNVLSRRARELQIPAKALSVWLGVVIVAFVSFLFNKNGFHPLASLPAQGWVILVGVTAAMFLATLVMQYGLTYTPSNQAIVILLSELVIASTAAYFLVHETHGLKDWIGGAMIIAASLFSGRMEDSND